MNTSHRTKTFCLHIFVVSGLVECQRQHFLTTPKDSEVTEGEIAILQCQVGNQIGQVQWTKDGLTLGMNIFLHYGSLAFIWPSFNDTILAAEATKAIAFKHSFDLF